MKTLVIDSPDGSASGSNKSLNGGDLEYKVQSFADLTTLR